MRKVRLSLGVMLCIVASALADDVGMIRLDKDVIAPLETVNITVPDVNDICTIYVTTPTGHEHSFGGAITDRVCSATYTPSYSAGTYEVYAVKDGLATETDEFVVASGNEAKDIVMSNWGADSNYYFPGQNIVFSFDLADSDGTPLGGFPKWPAPQKLVQFL